MKRERWRSARPTARLREGRTDWYSIKNLADAPSIVSIYDEIGYFGITAQDFISDLAMIKGDVELHLSTPGGEVFDGLAIFAALKQRSGTVTVIVDSLAASIGSVIAMSASPGQLSIMPNASLMIHDGFGLCIGNAADMRAEADLLDRVSDNIADVYAGRTGKPKDFWREQMLAETWYFGQEAVDAGLADRIAAVPTKQAPAEDDSTRQAMAAHFDLSVFRNTPDRLKAPYNAAARTDPVKVELEWVGPDAHHDFVAALRRNIHVRNQALEEPPAEQLAETDSPSGATPSGENPPPTSSQATPEAPADTDRGFSVPVGGAMDAIPRDQFRDWLNQGLQLIGEPRPQLATAPNGATVYDAASHKPFDGTHEYEHSHSGDADYSHDGGGEESDADGGMQNDSAHRVLGLESMPLLNKAIAVHHTATEDTAWDGPAAVAAMPAEYADLHYCHAWQSADADESSHTPGDDDEDDKKGAFKFPHHEKKGAPANLAACRNGKARLSGADIPDADRAGVEAHLQAHLDDAGEDDGASNHSHDNPGDAPAWDPDAFRKAMEGA